MRFEDSDSQCCKCQVRQTVRLGSQKTCAMNKCTSRIRIYLNNQHFREQGGSWASRRQNTCSELYSHFSLESDNDSQNEEAVRINLLLAKLKYSDSCTSLL